MTTRFITFLIGALFLNACINDAQQSVRETAEKEQIDTTEQFPKTISDSVDTIPTKSEMPMKIEISPLEQSMLDAGLVNIADLDSTIMIRLRYASTDNFLKEDLYDGLTKCYLHPRAAEKLVKAQSILTGQHPDYRLMIFDGARPRSVQQKMWDRVRGTEMERYVAEPVPGSLHNFGAAIDLTIADTSGNELDMGTDFDHFGMEAQPRYHRQMLTEGWLTANQIENRKLLKSVMKQAGYIPIMTEWWHFNAFSRAYVREEFTAIP